MVQLKFQLTSVNSCMQIMKQRIYLITNYNQEISVMIINHLMVAVICQELVLLSIGRKQPLINKFISIFKGVKLFLLIGSMF